MSPTLLAYRVLTGALTPLAPMWLQGRVRAGKEDAARWPERLAATSVTRPDGRLAWLHGASVGETLSLLPLLDTLRAQDPDLRLLVTSGTATSADLLARRLPFDVSHRFAPLDLPGAARRFIAQWRPDLAVFVESELWPNLLREARGRGASTALISARLSSGSLARWRRTPAAARTVFGGFDLVLAQDDATGAALAALGAADGGRLNLKLAGGAPPVDPDRLATLRCAADGRPILLAASTHAGEEEIVLDAFAALRGRGLLVLAPRHPARGPAVAALAVARGLSTARQGAGEPFGGAEVFVADALGELGAWFSLAASTLAAGSLLPGPGGHNPVEPARLAAPILTGPHVANWTNVYAALGDAAPRVADASALAAAWSADLDDPVRAKARATAAAQRLGSEAQAVDDAARRLIALTHRSARPTPRP